MKAYKKGHKNQKPLFFSGEDLESVADRQNGRVTDLAGCGLL
jgi:hypothetical protein